MHHVAQAGFSAPESRRPQSETPLYSERWLSAGGVDSHHRCCIYRVILHTCANAYPWEDSSTCESTSIDVMAAGGSHDVTPQAPLVSWSHQTSRCTVGGAQPVHIAVVWFVAGCGL